MEIVLADLTWIDVVDSAVKIVSGALVAGVFTYFVSKSRQNHDMNKTKYEQELQILKDIAEQIEKSNDYLNTYSHLSRSISLPSDAGQAKENSELVMSGFKAMTRAKGLAFLIGQNSLGVVLENMCESLLEFYYLSSDDIPSVEIDELEEKLTEASEMLKIMNKLMEELRLKVSDSYSNISLS
jgi:hypothetical protein